jgi:two-component system, OmpR family, response regulator ResD
MNKYKILIVDDESNMRNLIKIYLLKNGFEADEASGGHDAVQKFFSKEYDLVILDIMMPDLDGWAVCKQIRVKSNVPILMLTARSETMDKVRGLNIGADDYLVKPFEPDELVARVMALLRRHSLTKQPEALNATIEHEEILIDPEAREVKISGKTVDLTQKEFDLLRLLTQNPKRVYSRNMLLEQVWGQDFFGDERTVDTHIKNIRDKVNKAGLTYNPVQTVWGVGYKFNDRR